MSFFDKRKKPISLEHNIIKKIFYMFEDFIDKYSPLPFRYLFVIWVITIFLYLIVLILGPK